jgi:DNA polymerase III subunit delta'
MSRVYLTNRPHDTRAGPAHPRHAASQACGFCPRTPADFATLRWMLLRNLVGQDRAVAMLLRAVASGRLAHACLFVGPESVGKRTAALGMAMALACTEAPNQGCGECDTCRRIESGRHPDVLCLSPASQQYLVEQAREVVAIAATRPHEAKARTIILDRADCLNPSSANALLKTLEEPRTGNHLVLVTSAPDRLLATIRSRTQRISFTALEPAALLTIAMRQGVPTARAETAAAVAGGQAAELLLALESETGTERWTVVEGFRKAAAERSMTPVFEAASAFSDKESRQGLPEALALLARFYRDAMVTAVGAGELALLTDKTDELERLASKARTRYDLRTLRSALREVVSAVSALSSNVNAVTALEKMLMDLKPLEMDAV